MTLGTYQHYKGNRYQVIAIAKLEATLEDVVVYRALYGDGKIWVRPATSFNETVEVNGERIPRFRLVFDEKENSIQ
jgi:cyclomaltodextrinase